MSRVGVIAALVIGLVGCIEDVPPSESIPDGPYDSFAERPCPPDSILTYENFGGPFMNNWCVGCHSTSITGENRALAPEGLDFNDPNLIRPHLERIWVRAADQNATMPPGGGPPTDVVGGSMSPQERELLGEWLACGAPSDFDVSR